MRSNIDKELRSLIRACFETAQATQSGTFSLKGRGHEPRVSFSRQLAAILRDANLTRVYIPGYGPKHWYPERVAKKAASLIHHRLGKQAVKFHGTSVYLDLSGDTPTPDQPGPAFRL